MTDHEHITQRYDIPTTTTTKTTNGLLSCWAMPQCYWSITKYLWHYFRCMPLLSSFLSESQLIAKFGKKKCTTIKEHPYVLCTVKYEQGKVKSPSQCRLNIQTFKNQQFDSYSNLTWISVSMSSSVAIFRYTSALFPGVILVKLHTNSPQFDDVQS